MVNPEPVLPQDIHSAELAPLPVHTQPLLAGVLADVLVYLSDVEGQSALLALSVEVGLLAL
jgi:hypothetical protein